MTINNFYSLTVLIEEKHGLVIYFFIATTVRSALFDNNQIISIGSKIF